MIVKNVYSGVCKLDRIVDKETNRDKASDSGN